jgi:hypothetical protein
MRSRRRWIWLGVATVLFGLAAYLMAGAEETEAKPEVAVKFPEHQNRQELARAERRRVQGAALLALTTVDAGHARLRPSDPVLAALPPKGKGASAVVLEANAIRNSPVGELFIDCLRAHHGRDDPFDHVKQETGIDATQDLDRMAVTNEGVLLSGAFQNARWSTMFGGAGAGTPYGNQGTIYELPAPPGHPDQSSAAGRWGNGMMILGDNVAGVQAVIDRLEGRAPDAAPVLSESDSYGDLYGSIEPADLASLLPDNDANLAEQLKAAAEQVKLHMDATNDVAMVADVNGPDAQQVSDLGKTLGGALSLARLDLPGEGEEKQLLSDLLDQAKVDPGNGSFRVELALPLPMLQKHLGWCREATDAGAAPSNLAAAGEDPQRTTSAKIGP